MGPLAAVTALLGIIDKFMDKIPDYDQKKRDQFHELKLRFEEEKKRIYPDRDDDLIMNLRDQIIAFAEDFNKEIQ